MHLTKVPAVTALSSLIILSSSTPVHESPQADVACHTSDSSPVIDDVTDTVNQLYGRGGDCPNGDKECHTLVTHGSAAIQLCGAKLQTTDLTCEQVGDYVNQIKQMCQVEGLTEGTAKVDDSKWVVVGHS
ncbi:hypothetical protein PG989_005953 [Apiospora arundinis]